MPVVLQVGDRQWQRVLEMVRSIRALGMEVCTTLGMLTPDQVHAAWAQFK
jgi:biotin synthase